MIYQNDRRLNQAIRNSDGKFRCLLAIAEFEAKKSLTVDQIEEIYVELANKKNVLDHDCFCGQLEHRIINLAFLKLGLDRSGICIGNKGFASTPDYDKEDRYNWIMSRWTTGIGTMHCTLEDIGKTVSFDPWSTSFDEPRELHIRDCCMLYKTWEN